MKTTFSAVSSLVLAALFAGNVFSQPALAEASVLHRATVAEPDTVDPQKTFGAGALIVDYDQSFEVTETVSDGLREISEKEEKQTQVRYDIFETFDSTVAESGTVDEIDKESLRVLNSISRKYSSIFDK